MEHIVFFKLQISNEEEIELKNKFLEMKDIIKVICDGSFGKTFTTHRNKGYTHALRVCFKNKEDLPTYINHEVHQEFAKFIANYFLKDETPICLDYEI
jgi:hypothetical protein